MIFSRLYNVVMHPVLFSSDCLFDLYRCYVHVCLLRDQLLEKNYQEVVDFRNQIIHAYFGIDQDIVWEIINNDLKHFEQIIKSLILNIEPNLKQELIESFIEDNHYLDFIIEALRELNHA